MPPTPSRSNPPRPIAVVYGRVATDQDERSLSAQQDAVLAFVKANFPDLLDVEVYREGPNPSRIRQRARSRLRRGPDREV